MPRACPVEPHVCCYLARGLPLEVIAGKKRECEAAYNAVRRRQLRPAEQWSYQARYLAWFRVSRSIQW